MKQTYTTQFLFKNKLQYAAIPKEYLRDKNLSLKGKGLLTIIYTLPEEWNYNIKGLAKIANLTEKTLTKTLQELIENGYIWRDKKRKKNGQFYYDYLILIEPIKFEETL